MSNPAHDDTPETAAPTPDPHGQTSEHSDEKLAAGHQAPSADPATSNDPQATDNQDVKTWSDLAPWEPGKATRADKILLGFLLGVPLFYLALLPLRPFLIAKIPVLFAAVTGAKTVVAGAGAFAAVENYSLWLVVFAGWIGMVKFDWLFWYAGYRWGDRVIRLFTQNPRQQKQAEYIRNLPRPLLAVFIFLGRWPGVPGSIASLVAGWGKMPAWMFFTANFLGNLTLAFTCAYIGFAIGEPAVEFLRTIDKYALWVSLALVFGAMFWSSRKAARKA